LIGGILLKVMVIGSGGREHALTWKLAQSPLVSKVFCCPGNGGTSEIAENITIDPDDLNAMADFAVTEKIGLTVVEQDAYLAKGIVDLFQGRGLTIYGPTRAAAQLEWSKAFAKSFMKRHGIPTAHFEVFGDPLLAKQYLKEMGVPVVVKADGLAAGKGVIVAADLDTALQAVDQIMTSRVFGDSGAKVVIEEYLEGEEVSLLAFCDGKSAVPMLPAQDHKRIGDNDTGPNTGGMGAYAPATVLTPDLAERVIRDILNPTIQAMQAEGHPFTGTLYLGLMLTSNGPKVIEYNVRFGDPETQVILPLLDSDLAQIFMDAIQGKLEPGLVRWKKEAVAACVVAASQGYPGRFTAGKLISGLKRIHDSLIFHAGTQLRGDGDLITAGGRVLNLVHLGNDIAEAVAGAYRDIQQVQFEGIYYRKDIAWRELKRQV
jgi:phosphoribosylamine--glycine ligase